MGAIAGVMFTACNETPNGVPEAAVVTGDAANTCPATSVTLTASATNAQTYKWYNGTTLISGETTNTYVVKASGNYSAEGVNTVGTGTKSAGIEVTITSCGTGTDPDPDPITWTLNSGVLTISGQDTMPDYYREGGPVDFVSTPWYAQRGDITSVIIEDGITSIGQFAFFRCALTSVTIPNSVTSIGESAFGGSALTSVTIPNSVTSIGEQAFFWCEALTSVTIPNSVTSIGNTAFYYCSALTSVTIPNSVTSIGSDTFYECSALTSVTIGSGVTSIEAYAFSHCYALTSVTFLNPSPPAMGSKGNFFSGNSRTFYVPAGSVAAYQEAGWGSWGTIVEIVP
ncbi:hypothetical protein FACS189452_04050 [Bacteroidia bacterium]|nr:hypothetical protein FACS189452_04050 [Bacteroidia bacterium]